MEHDASDRVPLARRPQRRGELIINLVASGQTRLQELQQLIYIAFRPGEPEHLIADHTVKYFKSPSRS
jgi:hypothetical protein